MVFILDQSFHQIMWCVAGHPYAPCFPVTDFLSRNYNKVYTHVEDCALTAKSITQCRRRGGASYQKAFFIFILSADYQNLFHTRGFSTAWLNVLPPTCITCWCVWSCREREWEGKWEWVRGRVGEWEHKGSVDRLHTYTTLHDWDPLYDRVTSTTLVHLPGDFLAIFQDSSGLQVCFRKLL